MSASAEETYEVRCAWCGVVIDRSEVRDSHGICRECFDQVVGEIKAFAPEQDLPKFSERPSGLSRT